MNVDSTSNDFNNFPQYNIESSFLKVNGVETEQQVITKGGNLVATLDKKYAVLPNEACEDKMKEIGDRLGLVPMELANRSWFYVQPNKSSFTNKNKYGAETKWCSILLNPEPYTLSDGSEVKLGLVFKNSIDGAWAFSGSTFSFRTICENMCPHIARQHYVNDSRMEYVSMKNEMTPDQLRDHQTLQLSHGYRRHTVSLNVDEIIPELQKVYDGGHDYLKHWNELEKLKVTKELGMKIALQYPKWVTTSESRTDTDPAMADIIHFDKENVKIRDGFNQSQLFNAMTNALTHDGSNFQTTMTNFAKVDRQFFGGMEITVQ